VTALGQLHLSWERQPQGKPGTSASSATCTRGKSEAAVGQRC
jgi:hypothetical protein